MPSATTHNNINPPYSLGKKRETSVSIPRSPLLRTVHIWAICMALTAYSSAQMLQSISNAKVVSSVVGPSNFAYVASSVTACFNAIGTNGKCVYALHQTPGSGHLLIINVWWMSAVDTMTVTDPNNGTWTAIGSPKVGVSSLSTFRAQSFYVASAVASATTVTATASTAVNTGWQVEEYSYTGSIAGTDGTAVYSNTAASGGTATITGSATTNTSDLIHVACLAIDNSCSVGSGYTARNDASGMCSYNGTTCTATNGNYNTSTGSLDEDKVGFAPGTPVGTFSTGTTDNFIGGLVAF